jgi:poly-gamma-glutamate capsule biosynthesis protein CapA/YwtB (metallophosphatase superfamily)
VRSLPGKTALLTPLPYAHGMYEAETGQTSIALAGDVLMTRPMAVFREDRFLRLRELLHQADARFCNLEASVHHYLEGPHSQRQGGGTYMTTEPSLLQDLKWLGINMLACGSSHADDYGWDGVMETMDHLDAAGIVHAGSGRHLAESRAPSFLDTPRGRIALVAANGQFNPGARPASTASGITTTTRSNDRCWTICGAWARPLV